MKFKNESVLPIYIRNFLTEFCGKMQLNLLLVYAIPAFIHGTSSFPFQLQLDDDFDCTGNPNYFCQNDIKQRTK